MLAKLCRLSIGLSLFFSSVSISENGRVEQPKVYPYVWSRLFDRPVVTPRIILPDELSSIELGCPTGYPNCRILPRGFTFEKDFAFTNSLKTELIHPILEKDLEGRLQPGDVIVFSNQEILKEGGLSKVMNGNHHTALIGLTPDGKLAHTASPKPENALNFNERDEGFHILRMTRWPAGVTAEEKKKVLEYVQKYFDILNRSDETTGAIFDYQGDLDIADPKVLKLFAENLKNAPPGALMKDVFPGGKFRVFCSESAVTAYALAFQLIGRKYHLPRAEGMHQGINLMQREFREARQNPNRDPKLTEVDLMTKIMSDFFAGEALRIERNTDDPNSAADYTPEQKRQMASELLKLIKLGPFLAHAGLWAIRTTGLDWYLGENVRRAMYATSPYDLVMDPLKAGGRLEYVGTYVGPRAKIANGVLSESGATHSRVVQPPTEGQIVATQTLPPTHLQALRRAVQCHFERLLPPRLSRWIPER